MSEIQLGMDLGEAETPDKPLFDPAQVRRDAHELIGDARAAAEDGSWDADYLRFRRIMFPLLVSWLPDEDERAQLCFDFTREVERIELLLAA